MRSSAQVPSCGLTKVRREKYQQRSGGRFPLLDMCLGDLVTIDYSLPPARAVVCLHWSVVRKSVPGERVWWDIGSEAFYDVSLWGIRTAAGCAAVNTFLALDTYMRPSRTDGCFFCLPNEAFTDEGVSPVKIPF